MKGGGWKRQARGGRREEEGGGGRRREESAHTCLTATSMPRHEPLRTVACPPSPSSDPTLSSDASICHVCSRACALLIRACAEAEADVESPSELLPLDVVEEKEEGVVSAGCGFALFAVVVELPLGSGCTEAVEP